MNPQRQNWNDYDLDELELGTRVADALTAEMFGTLYNRMEDRAWSVVVHCYGNMARALGPGNVPAPWRPTFDSHGMWHLP